MLSEKLDFFLMNLDIKIFKDHVTLSWTMFYIKLT